MISATYVDSSHFTVEDDWTVEYTAGRKIQLIQGAGGVAWVACVSSSYSAITELTTVEVDPASVLETLVSVELPPTETISTAIHDHTEQDQAGDIPAAHMNQTQYDALIDLLTKNGVVLIDSGAFSAASSTTAREGLVVNEAGDGYEFVLLRETPLSTGRGELLRSNVPADCAWQGAWAESTDYYAYDVGVHDADIVYVTGADTVFYKCIIDHTAALDNKPGSGGSWELYWELVDLEWEMISSATEGHVLRIDSNGIPQLGYLQGSDIELPGYFDGLLYNGIAGDLLARLDSGTRAMGLLPIATGTGPYTWPPLGAVIQRMDRAPGDNEAGANPLVWREFSRVQEGEKLDVDPDLLIDDPLYLDPVTGKWRLATNAGNMQQADCSAICIVPNEVGEVPIQVLLWGPHTFDSDPSFTPGNRVYLGDGVIQDSEPVSGYSVILGRAEYGTSDKFFFNPEYVKPTT